MISSRRLPPVLIIGAHTMGLALLRAFKDVDMERIFLSYDRDDLGRASRYATRVLEIPHPETQTEQFIERLVNLSETYPGAVLFPASDPSLKAISFWKQKLNKSFIVACPEWDIVELVIDKKRTYELAEKYGVPSPKTIHPKTEEEVESYAKQVAFPIIVKPSQSHLYFDIFYRKMVLANNYSELIHAYRQASENNLEVVIQEYIPGEDSAGVNYNSYAINGQVLVEFTAAKLRNAPPNLGSPCVVKSACIPEVYETGRKMVEALSFTGYSCAEYKMDQRDGIYKLMEVNGRHNLSGLLAVKCGLNFPLLHYHHLVNGELPKQTEYLQGKYWIDLTRDTAYHFPSLIKRKLSLRDFLKPYRSNKTFAILDWKDLGPFIKRILFLMLDVFKRKRTL